MLAAAIVVLVGCADDGPDNAAPGAAVATIQVVDETFKVELSTPELIEYADKLLAGEAVAGIPLGTVVRDDPGVNVPRSWHIDPATLEFADMTIEVCDGLPSFVEDGTATSDQYCPWSAKVIAVDR